MSNFQIFVLIGVAPIALFVGFLLAMILHDLWETSKILCLLLVAWVAALTYFGVRS
jgi:hypothetical protein